MVKLSFVLQLLDIISRICGPYRTSYRMICSFSLRNMIAQAQLAYPYIGTYYGSLYGAYSGQPLVNATLMAMLPHSVPLVTDAAVEPIYVNARQYHGILRRRQSCAEAESENKANKIRKPYLHESRHLHALKRARGSCGRFLNSKVVDGKQDNKSVDKKDGAVPSEENRGNKETNSSAKSENASPATQPGADVSDVA